MTQKNRMTVRRMYSSVNTYRFVSVVEGVFEVWVVGADANMPCTTLVYWYENNLN